MYSVVVSPNIAFPLTISGIFLIYWELIDLGRIFPGLLGSALAAIGIYHLWLYEPTPIGSILVVASLVLFAAEFVWNCHRIAGFLGSILLAAGSVLLFDGANQIHPASAIGLSMIWGLLTTALASLARKARILKRQDVFRA